MTTKEKLLDKAEDAYRAWFNWSTKKKWRRVVLCIVMVPVTIGAAALESILEHFPALCEEVKTYIQTGK